MRITYLVCYDIADDKRLRRVFKTCRNFGDHLQFSVFECDLSRAKKSIWKNELGRIINHDEDQVIFVSLGRRRVGATVLSQRWACLTLSWTRPVCRLKVCLQFYNRVTRDRHPAQNRFLEAPTPSSVQTESSELFDI